MSLFPNRKEERMTAYVDHEIAPFAYNLLIGGVLLYGFVLNILFVTFLGGAFALMNPIVFLFTYIVMAVFGTVMANLSQNPIVSFIGYNFVVVPIGAVLSLLLPEYSASVIMPSIVVTAVIVAAMLIVATILPKFFAKLGRALLVTLIVAIVAEVVAALLGYRGTAFSWIFVILFSLYIGFDWSRAQRYPKTVDNAVDSALDIYLDIINLFIRLLDLFRSKRH